MLADILTILLVLVLAGSKYMMAIVVIYASDFTFWQSILLAVGGGMLGILIFSYFGEMLKSLFRYYFPKKNTSTFSLKNRMLVKVRSGYGLAGIALLTPVFLTVPVGAIMANSIYKNKQQVFVYMFLAFVFWSLLLCGAYYLLGWDISAMLPWS